MRRELLLFTWKVLIVAGAAALGWLVAASVHVLLLIFTGVLLAIFLTRLAGFLCRATGLPHGAALCLVLLAVLALLGGGGWVLGQTLAAQYGQLTDAITQAYAELPENLRAQLERGTNLGSWLGQLRSMVPPVLYGVTDGLIVLFAGLYMAAAPGLYRQGLLLLLPPVAQGRARQVLGVIGQSLWLWMVGQFVAMALVGVMTAAGLWLLGVPVPFQLGILAGLLEFLPYAGPILSAVPGLLIAFTQSPTLAVWTGVLYLAIHLIEGNLIQPQVQRAVVNLPPVVTIAAIAAGGYLFGILGVMIATPLAVAAMGAVNMLYLSDQLGEERHFPSPEKVPTPAPQP
jgi:predicted PurR-regulated permease PerM